ncbi:unnamed protein product [Nippostrongylus brasiliensis]|uniref:Secreted protein n=1 Tax=Nippostrongylus brasiliensis TaxID=27835 RepID=A0A0N4XQ62_NIPBR|nr:unnamed protein product [Nippostrongylus brasiliensis]
MTSLFRLFLSYCRLRTKIEWHPSVDAGGKTDSIRDRVAVESEKCRGLKVRNEREDEEMNDDVFESVFPMSYPNSTRSQWFRSNSTH